MSLNIPRKGRSSLAQMIWRQANRIGLAFRKMTAPGASASDLDERLRKSQQKKRQLQHRIKQLLEGCAAPGSACNSEFPAIGQPPSRFSPATPTAVRENRQVSTSP